MKKLLSMLLSLVMLVGCAVGLVVPASAAEPAAAPSALPNGNGIDVTKTWVDWSELGLISTFNSVDDDGMMKIGTAKVQVWSGSGNNTLSEPLAWHGASGVMFYVDASDVENVDFMLEMLSDGSRPSSDTSNGYTQLNTAPNSGSTTTAYYYGGTAWTKLTTSTEYISVGTAQSGWYYVPLTSFIYKGGSAKNLTTDNAYGKNFVEFMSNFEKARVIRMSVRSSVVGLKFGDINLVYELPENISEQYSTAPLFDTLTASTQEGGASATVNGGSVTVTNMNANSTSNSNTRSWLNGLNVTNLANASGLRFYVDASALDDDAALQLRIRLMSNVKVASATDVYKNGGNGNLVSSPIWPNPQYVCRAENSVAYYFGDDGSEGTLNITSGAADNSNGDLFEGLPANYKGYVYIPFDSYWMCATSFNHNGLYLPFSVAGANYPLTQIAICHAIENYTTGDSDAVTYSDFQVVYEDTAFSGASISLANNVNVNFYANIQDDTTLPTLKYSIAGTQKTVNGEKVSDGVYKFVCSDILPQMMTDSIDAMLSAKIGDYTVSSKLKYSIREYCETMLADGTSDTELKTLLVDLLYYGEAAQKYAGYKTDDLATKNLSDEQKALRSADTVSAITAQITNGGSASEEYSWQSTALRCEGSLALKLKLYAADTENLTAEVALNGRTTVYDTFEEGAGYYTVIFRNIGAAELDDEITLTLKKNGETVGQTVTCSVAAYLKALSENAENTEAVNELIRSIYAYGSSAKTYSAQ